MCEVSPSVVERDWLLRRRDGLKRVRSLKLQLFCTLTGLEPSALISEPGERRSVMDVCLLLMLWPRGLAILTRSLKLSFWLRDGRRRDIKHGRLRFCNATRCSQAAHSLIFFSFLSLLYTHPLLSHATGGHDAFKLYEILTWDSDWKVFKHFYVLAQVSALTYKSLK